MTPLNVSEWLQAERIAGNDYANELLDLVDGEQEALDNADAFRDLRKLMPRETKPDVEAWRVVEWVEGQLHLLDEIRDIVDEFGGSTEWPEHMDVADKLRDMFDSPRWRQYDL